MTISYTITQWMFFFYFYCFFGWCFESTFVSIKSRKIVNRGFMRGPFLPLYGSGAIMMLVVSAPFKDNLWLTFLAGCIGATILEYVTGVVMESLFKIRYWDYSDLKFNIQGQVCLSSTIAWGFLTIAMTQFIHRPIEQMALAIPPTMLSILTMLLTVFIVSDFTLSFKAALDLRDVLVKMEKAKEELQKVQKRLDVMIAVAGDAKDNMLTVNSERIDDILDNIESKFVWAKEMVLKVGLSDEMKEELIELRAKFRISAETRSQLAHLKDFYKREMIKGNPGMYSKKFMEAFEEIKKSLDDYMKK